MRVLMATDGSEDSNAAIQKCAELFNRNDLVIKVVSVVPPMIPAAEPFSGSVELSIEADEAAREQSKSIVADAEEKVKECFGESAVDCEVLVGSPAQRIVGEAQNWKADLIVAGSHGYGFWERMLLGSVSQSIAQHAPCSVLIVRGEKNSS